MVGTEQGNQTEFRHFLTSFCVRKCFCLQQEGQEPGGEDCGDLSGALRSSLRSSEEPVLPEGDVSWSDLIDMIDPEFPDGGRLVRQDLVRGHQGERHHVDQLLHGEPH